MLDRYFSKGAMEGTVSGQPFIDNDCQRILVAGRTRMRLDLFRGHIGDGASHILCILVAGTLSDNGNTEVAEQDLTTLAKQHVLWLDVPVNQLLVMGIL